MIVASHKRKTIKDWKEMGYCKALCSNKLRKNDYSVFRSILMSHIMVIVMAICICIAEDNFVGIPICSVFLHLFWTDMALASNLASSRNMTLPEVLLLFLSYVLHYGISIWYLFYAWDWENMEHSLISEIGDSDTTDETSARYFFIFFIVLIPLLSATFNARKKYIDDRDSHIKILDSKVFIGLFVISLM
jgi:hypothetical protein